MSFVKESIFKVWEISLSCTGMSPFWKVSRELAAAVLVDPSRRPTDLSIFERQATLLVSCPLWKSSNECTILTPRSLTLRRFTVRAPVSSRLVSSFSSRRRRLNGRAPSFYRHPQGPLDREIYSRHGSHHHRAHLHRSFSGSSLVSFLPLLARRSRLP